MGREIGTAEGKGRARRDFKLIIEAIRVENEVHRQLEKWVSKIIETIHLVIKSEMEIELK